MLAIDPFLAMFGCQTLSLHGRGSYPGRWKMRAFPADPNELVRVFGMEGQFEQLKVGRYGSHSALGGGFSDRDLRSSQVWQQFPLATDELGKMSRLASTLREGLLKRKQELALSSPLRGGPGAPTLLPQSLLQSLQSEQQPLQLKLQSQGSADPADVQMSICWRLPGSATQGSEVAHASEMPTATGLFEATPNPQPVVLATRTRSRRRIKGSTTPSHSDVPAGDFEAQALRLSQSAASSGQAGQDVPRPSLAHARARFGDESLRLPSLS